MTRRKTHEEFLKELNKVYEKNVYIPLEEYINANTKILVKHNCDRCNYYEWEITPHNLLQNKGCPKCGGTKKKIHEEFTREIKEKYGGEYEVLEKYVNNHTKILVRHNCEKCNCHEWTIKPNDLLRGQGCPVCRREKGNLKKTKTHDDFIEEVEAKYGDGIYIPLEKYIGSHEKILVRHNCGYEWYTKPANLLQGKGCPVCGKEKRIKSKTKTHEEFVKELNKVHGENIYIPLERYIGANSKILVKHNQCGHEWRVISNHLLSGNGCPVCGGKVAKLGINTIWDTDRWMVDLGMSEENAKKYTSRSGQKIIVKCPDCGREKRMIIDNIYKRKSIGCSCGDGKSYPEKFVMSLLEQLGLEFEIEYSPEWGDNKRYDFYFKKSNMIIETHGRQHYEETSRKGDRVRTLVEEQLNDKYKKDVALANGIKYYIELDCRESNLEYIKNRILKSELTKLFNLNNINWNKCAEFANKNIVKEVCNYWNNKRNDETTSDVGVALNLSRGSVVNYLKKGTKLGWCNYNFKKEIKKISKRNGKLRSKKVEIFKNNKSLGIFKSCVELERQSEKLFGVKLLNSGVASVCRGKTPQYKDFTFKYVEELTPEERIKYNIDEKLKELEKKH